MLNYNLKLKIFKFLILFFFFSFLFSLQTSPVWARSCASQGYQCCPQNSICIRPQPDLNFSCQPGYQCCEECKEGGITNPVIGIFGSQPGQLTIAQLLASFLRLSLSAAGILFLFYFVWASILYLTSQGELVLVVISLINEIFNLNILQLELPTPLKP